MPTRTQSQSPSTASQRTRGLYSLLSVASVYSALSALAVGDARRIIADEYVRASPGERMLDLGCGPGLILQHLPRLDYLGVDIEPHYIRAAHNRFGHRAKFLCKDALDLSSDEVSNVDIALAIGLLHHLNDADVLSVLHFVKRLLKPEGRLITWDGVYIEKQSILARLLLKLDRGQYVRTLEHYLFLAGQVFPVIKHSLRHDTLRVPYTILALECRNA